MGKRLDIKPGDRFSRLVIIRESEKRKGRRFFLCRCDCGIEKNIKLACLRSGDTKSCGCYKNDLFKERNTTHGLSGGRDRASPLYKVWTAMRQRCLNKNNPNYKRYGGRGITICKARSRYQKFHKWALVSGYKESLSIERINNNKGYEPRNCTWIPLSEQSKNTRRNKRITFNGKTKILKEWSTELKISYDTLFGRLARGWDAERALSTPSDQRFNRYLLGVSHGN